MSELTRRFDIDGKTCTVTKEKTDPLCSRVSIGGSSPFGCYFVFKGDDRKEIIKVTELALKAFKEYDSILTDKGE